MRTPHMPEQGTAPPDHPGRPATIHHVARLAGVSHQTVSRFLRNDPTMRPETARKVSRAVDELDYRPNLAARSMRTRRSNRIAVILPDATNFVPAGVLSGAAAAAHEAGYLLDIVGLAGDAAERAARIGTLLQPEHVDGILSFTPLAENLAAFARTTTPRVPVVVDGQYDDNMRSRGLLADATAAADIVEHLAGLGHREFAHVAGPPSWPSARNRRAVYEATVARLGLTSRAVVEGDWSVRSGFEGAVEAIAGSGATAVFAANDRVAFGVVRGLQSVGVDVPGEVSVFGWDDEEMGRYLDPPLSTVRVDRERQGREAVRRLLRVLAGDPGPEPDALDATELHRLVLRGSTGPAPARAG
ncbi:LacI family DNA-binding transcriptional regulator [Streptomyces marincola]|nr:LacI family DNA-binding transcriptional regulator [Streptomyces marincola]